jgi:DNA-binding response OmpR family regulator
MATKVLVVEDDLEINELLGEYLGLENIAYVQAVTGQSGIHQAVTEHPDAMILDLMLPDIDGFAVAKSLTMKRATFDIPIVILSCMCQAEDVKKGFAAGALFYVNKPFLPDDLLTTLRKALEWKTGLREREPAGSLVLGQPGVPICAKGTNQMVADIFARTALSDAAVMQIRQAVETMSQWADQWNVEHQSATLVRLDYRITPGVVGQEAEIEWTLSENAPGMLAEGFFKPAPNGQGSGVAGGAVGAVGAVLNALPGWGSSLMVKPLAPIAPPAKWLQMLAKTGAGRFEKDTKAKTVRFARGGGRIGAEVTMGQVPIVQIDGNRYPTRLRGEALAARRK